MQSIVLLLLLALQSVSLSKGSQFSFNGFEPTTTTISPKLLKRKSPQYSEGFNIDQEKQAKLQAQRNAGVIHGLEETVGGN